MTATITQAIATLEAMELQATEINAMLEPLPERSAGNRQEALWNAYSVSGGLVVNIKSLRGWLRMAERESGT